jgi:hypothetical protein
MPISGSVSLGVIAAPSMFTATPYTVYSVTNTGGIFLAGFTLTNTANLPVSVTIYLDSYANVLYSGTLAALAGPTQVQINTNLINGQKILALATMGGMLNIEIDGVMQATDAMTMYLQAIVLMMSDAFGIEIPSQNSLAGSNIFTP